MPDNKWWLAQNVKIASYNGSTVGSAVSGCTEDECGRRYTYTETIAAWGGTGGTGANIQGVCPSSWILPVNSEWMTFITTIDPTISWTTYTQPSAAGAYTVNAAVIKKLIRPDAYCDVGSDIYGWAQIKEAKYDTTWRNGMLCWWCGQHHTYGSYNCLNHIPGSATDCGYISAAHPTIQTTIMLPVRCFRQL